MRPGMIYGFLYNICYCYMFCMQGLRLCTQRMEEMVLIDGITNVEYRFRCKWSHRVMGQICFFFLLLVDMDKIVQGLVDLSQAAILVEWDVHGAGERGWIPPRRLFYCTNGVSVWSDGN